jgi:hypothetical protein
MGSVADCAAANMGRCCSQGPCTDGDGNSHAASWGSSHGAGTHTHMLVVPQPCLHRQVRLPAQRPVKAVREPMDQYCGEANADAIFKGETVC